ncbi:hypothetical protein C2E23DRAFT_815715, partial [Lenzites betulinus]
MLPLLRALSLLQNAPATACIISCVRALLSEIGCLSRDAVVLKQHGVLAQERKRILSDLASLSTAEERRELEVQAMVRLAGQLFAHCGVNIPSGTARTASDLGTLMQDDDGDDDCFATPPSRSSNGIETRPWRVTNNMTPTRPKSLGDLKASKQLVMGADYPPLPADAHRIAQRKLSEQQLATPARRVASSSILGHKVAQDSISSTSSSSSFSSSDSSGAPATPVFPLGSVTSAASVDALRATHDAFLSTIAAFIGHAHSHSRTSHASSTGHMYELVREVVDMVCWLLTIVEADAFVTSTLADSDYSEEEEKARLLRCATDSLKAGSDCVAAVKQFLQCATGEQPFAGAYTPRKFSHAHHASSASSGPRIRKASTLAVLHDSFLGGNVGGEEEDMTIQHTMRITEEPPSPTSSLSPSPSPVPDSVPPTPITPTTPEEVPLPPSDGRPSIDTLRSDILSDNRTTWEGSTRHGPTPSILTFEEKLMTGELPPIPGSRLAGAVLPWTLPHDHAPEDLVGATLEALVERMTPHDSLVEPPFAAVFFMMFRLFASPLDLLATVIERYNILPPPGLCDADLRLWQQRKGLPVRLRVSNFIDLGRGLLATRLRQCRRAAILVSFTKEALSVMFPGPQRMNSSENVLNPRIRMCWPRKNCNENHVVKSRSVLARSMLGSDARPRAPRASAHRQLVQLQSAGKKSWRSLSYGFGGHGRPTPARATRFRLETCIERAGGRPACYWNESNRRCYARPARFHEESTFSFNHSNLA